MAGHSGALCAFSGDGRLFAAVSSDNRLKVWDAHTGALRHQFTQSSHLSAAYTCLAWVPPQTQQKRRRSSGAVQQDSTLALGTVEGDILVWDMVRGEVVQTLSHGSKRKKADTASPVSDICPTASGQLYSCSEDSPDVLLWSLTDGRIASKLKADKRGVSSLALTNNGSQLITGGSAHITAWDVASGKPVAKMSSHSTSVRSLCVLPSQTAFLSSGGEPDRFINLWQVDDEHEDASAPNRTFVCTATPFGLTANAALHTNQATKSPKRRTATKRSKGGDGETSDHQLAHADSGAPLHFLAVLKKQVLLWCVEGSEPSTRKPVKPSCVVKLPVGEAKDKETAFLSASFAGADTVVVARGSLVKPKFDRVVWPTLSPYRSSISSSSQAQKYVDGLKVAKDITLEGKSSVSLIAENGSEAQTKVGGSTSEVKVLSAVEMGKKGGAKLSMPVVQRGVAPETGSTFAERLQALQEEQDGSRGEVSESGSKPRSGQRRVETPTASSILSMLSQALQSKDTQLLEACLAVSDKVIINNTVQRISHAKVNIFLEILVEKFQTRPSRGAQLVPWMKALLSHHMAYLMSSPDLSVLASLYHAVNAHLAGFDQLMSLSGRLDLLLVQIDSRSRAQAETAAASLNLSVREVLDEDEEPSSSESESESEDSDVDMEDDFDMGDVSEDDSM